MCCWSRNYPLRHLQNPKSFNSPSLVNNRLSALLIVLLSLCMGAMTVFAFAPFGYWPIQFATLAIMFYFVHRSSSVRSGTLIGLAYGFGWSVCGVHWLYVSMHRYGGLPAWIAILAVIAMSLVLGSFSGLAAGCSAWLQKRWRSHATITLLLILPALWALSEWLRGWVFTGLPWVVSGYAHNTSPLAGFAPIIGVFGLGWCAAFIAGCIAVMANRRTNFRIGALMLTIAMLVTGFGLKHIDWTEPNGQPITVRLLQGNVPQEMKFSRDKIVEMLKQYHDMIIEKQADLIATPETAIPILSQQLPPDYLPLLTGYAQKTKSHLLIGIPIFDGPQAYSNSVIGIAPTNTPHYRYNKHHLVPFGEFVPPGFRWFVNLMRIPLGDFSRGDTIQAAFAVKDQWVLPNICYEDLFGEEIADQIAAGHYSEKPEPTILLNLSNIAWFGDTIALPQHLQISQMRALETGRPMLRSTNTGATAAIDHKGKVIAQLTPYTQASLSVTVQGYKGATPYIRWGNLLLVALVLLSLVVAAFLSRRYRRTFGWS
jgi:apolipoprotein N-acyltransferase